MIFMKNETFRMKDLSELRRGAELYGDGTEGWSYAPLPECFLRYDLSLRVLSVPSIRSRKERFAGRQVCRHIFMGGYGMI